MAVDLKTFIPLPMLPLNEWPPDKLVELKTKDIRWQGGYWDGSVRRFAKFAAEFKQDNLWRHFGVKSWEDFCTQYFKKPYEFIDVSIKTAESLETGDWTWATLEEETDRRLQANIAKEQAINLSQEELQSIIKPGRPRKIDPVKVKELRDQGMTQAQVAEELGCSEGRVCQVLSDFNNPDNIRIIKEDLDNVDDYGTSQKYLLRKLRRDCPELLPEIGKGKKYPSARSAAIAAGIIKPKISFQVSPEESGASIASKLYQKLSKDQLIELTTQLTNLVLEDTTND